MNFLSEKSLFGQCTSAINTFPYSEQFETSNGGWTTGGNFSDWTWGTPAKTVITSAGQGSKCWITGGLSNASYNSNEYAWLQSPCFDFSTFLNPQISFLVFWETERRYDGATFQYGIDAGAGTIWTTLGTDNSNSTCQGTQWYNYSPINFLGSQPGWSGNIQPTSGSCLGGSGSAGWVQARHSLAMLAGYSNVRFRFLFAAGLTCNQFDGFAVDNILIDQATPVGSVDFTGTCINANTISFNNLNTTCRSSVAWDFGDPNSGVSNTGSSDNPTHAFSGPGTYSVTMTVTFNNGQTSVKTKSFTILAASANIVQPILCNGDANGALDVSVSGGSGPYFYAWNTNPVKNTSVIDNLPAGAYTINVSSPSGCEVSSSVTLAEPVAILPIPQITDEICGNAGGGISLNISGGVSPYTYQWINGTSLSSIDNLDAGIFSVIVTDANGCSRALNNIEVKNIINTVQVSLGRDTFICPGQAIQLSPGNYASYLWQDGSTASSLIVSSTGNYSVDITDDNGCVGSGSIRVSVDCSDIYFPTAFTPNADGLNDTYGPVGNIGALSNYHFSIYNRYGQLVFASDNPLEKWSGYFRGRKSDMQGFCWLATYSLNGSVPKLRKGNFLLLY